MLRIIVTTLIREANDVRKLAFGEPSGPPTWKRLPLIGCIAGSVDG
jgi:hypothetical protein